MEFKKGDKVIYKVPDYERSYPFNYEATKTGVVEDVYEDGLPLVAVNFGKGFNGHNCGILDIPDTCWNCEIEKLTLAQEPDPTQTCHFDKHYNELDIQPIEVMQALLTPAEFLGFLKGNIIKYSYRCGKKDAPESERAKFERYTEWYQQALKGLRIDPRK